MLQSKNKKLIPNEALIYERANGVIYARYRDHPHNKKPRWIVGGDPEEIAKEQGYLGYDNWKELFSLADSNPTLRKHLDKVLDIYYLIKDKK
jgi:hypothetical protein